MYLDASKNVKMIMVKLGFYCVIRRLQVKWSLFLWSADREFIKVRWGFISKVCKKIIGCTYAVDYPIFH